MLKAKETLHLSWDGRYPIDLKNDKGKGKTTRLVAKNKKEGPKLGHCNDKTFGESTTT
jgi:hypothetical protein